MAAPSELIIYTLPDSVVNAGEDRAAFTQRVVSGTTIDLVYIALYEGDILPAGSPNTDYAFTELPGPQLVTRTSIQYDAGGGNNRWRDQPSAGGASYTDEAAQDAVGGILTDSTSIDLTYNDGANTITADAIFGSTSGTVAQGNHNHDATYAALSHNHAAGDITSGTVATARLGSGTANSGTYLRGDQTWAAVSGGGALDDLSDVAITGAAEGEAVTHDGTSFVDAMHVNFTLGPFYLANPTASGANQQMRLGIPTSTTTSFNQTLNPIKMQRSGRIIGAILVSNAARTGGTLTARALINGSGADIGSGGCALDAGSTTSDSVFVGYVNGAAFSGGDTIGMAVTGSSWAPTTADITGWLVVQLIAHTG